MHRLSPSPRFSRRPQRVQRSSSTPSQIGQDRWPPSGSSMCLRHRLHQTVGVAAMPRAYLKGVRTPSVHPVGPGRYVCWMKAYLDLLRHIMDRGVRKSDRTGTGTLSVFGYQMRCPLDEGFPLLTTKKVHTKSIIYELLWFLAGSTNVRDLQKHGVSIWDEWADEDGELGPVYGYQWRSWPAPDGRRIDQIANLLEQLRSNPDSRRHIVSAWNVADVDQRKLPPCHSLFQFYVADSKLSCQLYQRSADLFLGVPFNIASYSLMLMMVAQVCGLKTGEFIHTFGDLHLYSNHLDQAKLQLAREPRALPTMVINSDVSDIYSFQYGDFELQNYEPHPSIKAPIAV